MWDECWLPICWTNSEEQRSAHAWFGAVKGLTIGLTDRLRSRMR